MGTIVFLGFVLGSLLLGGKVPNLTLRLYKDTMLNVARALLQGYMGNHALLQSLSRAKA